MKRSMQFEFEFSVERWRSTTPKPADWLCGPPHFHDVPPECRVQALQDHLHHVRVKAHRLEEIKKWVVTYHGKAPEGHKAWMRKYVDEETE